MIGTSKCFFGLDQGDAIAAELGPARSFHILSQNPLNLPPLPRLDKKKMPLAEAITQTFALHTGEDSILVYNNQLYLNFSPETHSAAGLELRRKKNRFHGNFALTKINKRLQWALENTLTAPLEFQTPALLSDPILPITITLEVPPLKVPDSELADWAPHLLEWIGLAILGSSHIEPGQAPNPVICNYFSYPGSTPQKVYRYSAKGLVTPEYATALLKSEGWLALSVQGFDRAPIAWNRPHHADQGPEHGYTIFKPSEDDKHKLTFKIVSRGDL